MKLKPTDNAAALFHASDAPKRTSKSDLRLAQEEMRRAKPKAYKTVIRLMDSEHDRTALAAATIVASVPDDEAAGAWWPYCTHDEVLAIARIRDAAREREAAGYSPRSNGSEPQPPSTSAIDVEVIQPSSDAFGPDNIPAPTPGSEAQPTPTQEEDPEWLEV